MQLKSQLVHALYVSTLSLGVSPRLSTHARLLLGVSSVPLRQRRLLSALRGSSFPANHRRVRAPAGVFVASPPPFRVVVVFIYVLVAPAAASGRLRRRRSLLGGSEVVLFSSFQRPSNSRAACTLRPDRRHPHHRFSSRPGLCLQTRHSGDRGLSLTSSCTTFCELLVDASSLRSTRGRT